MQTYRLFFRKNYVILYCQSGTVSMKQWLRYCTSVTLFFEQKLELDFLSLLSSPHLQASKAISGKVHRPINMNHYATKKSAAQSMLDVALLMANSSQLKTLLYVGPQYRFYIPLIVLLSLSISLQVAVGLLLVFIGK